MDESWNLQSSASGSAGPGKPRLPTLMKPCFIGSQHIDAVRYVKKRVGAKFGNYWKKTKVDDHISCDTI